MDPSRVEADNEELLSVLGSLSGGMTGGQVTTQLVECDCDTDPECVCEEEETEEEEEETEEEEEEETEEKEEMEKETGEEEEKEIEKRQDDDRPADYETVHDDGEEEVDLLELQDESEINYQRKAAALERKIELLEDLLESETVEAEQETLRGLLEKAWSELESLEEEGGEEVLGTEAMAVLKAQIEEDDRKKAKDEL